MDNNSIVDFLDSRGLASDFASRKRLAEAAGKLNYVGSANDNTELLAIERAKAVGNKISTPSTGGISVSQLQKETPINVPAVPRTNTANTYMTPITGAASSVQTALDQVNKQYQTAYNAQINTASDINRNMELLLGRTADTATAETVAGVTDSTQNLLKYVNDLEALNAQSSALSRQSQVIPLALQEAATGKGVTDAGLAPEQAGELRKNAIKALTIAQQADITQAAATGALNKLNEAKAKADQIIDLKYKPIQDSLNVRMKQYELAKDVLTSIDKERTNLLETKLKQEQTMTNYFISQEKEKSDLIRKAAPYAPQALLQRASEAKDAQSAAIILGTYSGDYLANQKINQEIVKLQIENGTYNANSTNLYGTITKDNGFTIEDFKRGIEAVESLGAGGYSALGKVMDTGMYKGDRAYGKYQVMGKNIPEWTKSALGYSMTPQQFLASPQAQEKVFENQSELNYAKFGNWDDVASVWFSGKPLSGNTASDGTTTVPQYVQKMRKGMGVTEPTQFTVEGFSPKVVQSVQNGAVAPNQLVSATTGQIPKNVGAEEQKGISAVRDLISKVDEYKVMFEKEQNRGIGAITGTGLLKGAIEFAVPNVQSTALETLKGEIVDLLSKARSGAALSAFEEAQYNAKLPTLFSADQVFGNPITVIDGFKSSLEGTLQTKLNTYGVVFAPNLADIYQARMEAARSNATSGGNKGGYDY